MSTQDTQFICQVDLTVDADWNNVRKVYHKIKEKRDAGHFHREYKLEYDSEVYSLGALGFISSSTSLTSESEVWDMIGGKIIEKILPADLIALRDDMTNAGLNFINFNYYQHLGHILEHVDGKEIDEGKHGHCNINYIVSSDTPNSTTFARKHGHEESYRSIPSTAWLLNTTINHGVRNTGLREIFQIKIFSPFDDVRQFLQERSMLSPIKT